MSAKTVLVTGATGFLGHHVVSQLVERGDTVRALVRNPDTESAQRLPEAAKRVVGDVLDPATLSSAVAGCDAVLHCAGKVSRNPEDAVDLFEINVRGTENVLDAASEAGVRRVVVASTSGTIAVSEDDEHIGRESDPTPVELINRWPYYRSKLYAEKAALERNSDSLEVVIVNPSILLGPGDLHASSTEDVRRMLEQRTPVSPAGGVSFVDARDAASGMIAALERGAAGERYLLTACNCTTQTFLSRIARVADMEPPMFALPNSKGVRKLSLWLVDRAQALLGEDESLPDHASLDMAQHYWYCDASRAENELQWTSRDPMVTLADTVEDMRARGIVMASAPKT